MKLNKQTYKSGLDCFRKGYFEKTKENKTNPQETYMVFYNYQKLKDLAVLYMKDKYSWDITQMAELPAIIGKNE